MKFTNFKHKEITTFTSKRMVYMASAEEMTQTATQEMAEAADKVENQVKLDKMDPYKALKEAKVKIFVAWQVTSEKVAPTPNMKHKAEIIKLLDRLSKAKNDANKKLDDNMNHYVEVAAFIKKRTELELRLESNKTALGSIEAQLLFQGIEALENAMTAFDSELVALSSMPDVGMESEKNELKQKIEVQKKDMEKLKKKLIEYHKEKIAMNDERLESIKRRFEPDFMSSSIISERTMRDLYAHLYYLNGLRVSSPSGLEIAGLTEEVEKRRKDFEDTLSKADKYVSMDSTMDQDHKPYWEGYLLAQGNFLRAEAKLKSLRSNPNSTADEIQKAKSWYDGAQQNAEQQLGALKQKYVQFRENEGNTKAFERDMQSVERGADRNETFASGTIKQMKAEWDKYDELNAGLQAAESEAKAAAPKGKGSKESQDAEVKLFHAKKKFNEHLQKIRQQYAGMGPDDVTQDLYEEKFYDGTLRIGTTTVEHVEPKEKPAPADKPASKKPGQPAEKPVPKDLPVAASQKPGSTKKA